MKSPKVLNFLGCVFLLVTIIGCTSPISRTLRQEAASGVTFPMVFQNPDAFQGDTVIWGGSIIRTVNTKEGSRICILETSLNMKDRPEAIETSEGRFIAVTDRQLDPLVYAKGKKITVAGKVIGKKTMARKRTGISYTYPLVQIEQLHLWHRHRHAPPSYWGPYWGPYWWGYDPFWDFSAYGGFEGEEEGGRRFEGRGFEGRGFGGHEEEGREGRGFEGGHERR
jgi:outer membrane lipoprotein